MALLNETFSHIAAFPDVNVEANAQKLASSKRAFGAPLGLGESEMTETSMGALVVRRFSPATPLARFAAFLQDALCKPMHETVFDDESGDNVASLRPPTHPHAVHVWPMRALVKDKAAKLLADEAAGTLAPTSPLSLQSAMTALALPLPFDSDTVFSPVHDFDWPIPADSEAQLSSALKEMSPEEFNKRSFFVRRARALLQARILGPILRTFLPPYVVISIVRLCATPRHSIDIVSDQEFLNSIA